MLGHGIKNVKAYKEDAKKFDYSLIGPLAFCLFDVDLYNPTMVVLSKLYDILIPGGIIIVDDCAPDLSIYDGAGEVYSEFCRERGIEQFVVHSKLGVIRKPINDLIE